MFSGKKVVVGISGGISAYKACDVVSWLNQNHAEVHVVMTAGAAEIITPLTLQTLSGRPVIIDEFATGPGYQVVHISVVENADLLVILPATANTIAKIAHGIADNALTSAVLAATCPLFLAPAMNVNMYNNAATQANLEILRQRSWQILEPAEGHLACGTSGKGRLPDFATLKSALTAALQTKKDLAGKTVMVTAGPTIESIDPVRYLTNRSTGKMGYAIAASAAARGAKVILVSGPTALSVPYGVECVAVESAQDMLEAVLQRFGECDVVIKAAAVADFTVPQVCQEKIKKGGSMELKLSATTDILYTLGQQKQKQILVGFAAETNNVIEYAKDKLARKNLDLIVANDVSRQDAGFACDTNVITIIGADGSVQECEKCSKSQAAEQILDAVSRLLK